MAELTDEQYLKQLAKHYANSNVPEMRAHHERLLMIASRVGHLDRMGDLIGDRRKMLTKAKERLWVKP